MATTSDDDRLLATQSDAASRASPPPTAPTRRTLRPRHTTPARSRRTLVTILLLLLACLLLLTGGIAFSVSPGLAFFSPGAMITLTPRSRTERQTVTVLAVTGTPAKGQAQARVLLSAPPAQHTTVPATGSGHQGALVGHGEVTFFNLATYAISIPAGVLLTGSDKVVVVTDASVTVPAGNPPTMGSAPVAAHAQHPGPAGNVAAGDIDTLCCANGIVARNSAPFVGGQDARSYTVVRQQDVQSATVPLETALTQRAQSALKIQLRAHEQLLQPQCTPSVQAAPPVGGVATQVAVTVSVSCRSEAFNEQQVAQLASASSQQQEHTALGSSYAPIGQIGTSIEQASVINARQGSLAIVALTSGQWVYQIDHATLRSLLKQIAGKDTGTARTILMQAPGIASATVQLSGWNTNSLPTDGSQIEMKVIQPHAP